MEFNSLFGLVSFILVVYLLSEQLNWTPIMESVKVIAWGVFKLSVWILCCIRNTTWLLFALCFSCLKKSWCHSCFGHGGEWMLAAEWSDSWRTSLQSLKCCSLICLLLWTNHLQSLEEGEGKNNYFCAILCLLYKGIYGEWLLNMCTMLWTHYIKPCLVMVFFHIMKVLCTCQVWNKKTKVGISDLDALVKKEREKPAEPPL